ncbi:hypothetical protein DAPPUDRAFT_332853 [Daphnia pulex]|uniref:Uncharacterized protein n=1 Tax=Daphnia pulex TaxID=6669 RepID=E9HR44_DAPPU|nr:hypothetical protein DAPPUDRAFT_332853 [Daphnia pulex]|eukprot:EFX65789.1 hypothetical protein DAPPUDRAFT_332853 [Daphnia pulex]
MSFQKKDLQQDSLFANPLAATLESPYLSTTKKEVTYCDAYHHYVAYKTKCGASGYPSIIRLTFRFLNMKSNVLSRKSTRSLTPLFANPMAATLEGNPSLLIMDSIGETENDERML